jgi:predicted nucleotidyltransferase
MEDAVERAIDKLRGAVPSSSKVILFGSRARGSARPSSDLDFLVIEERVESRHREMGRLRAALRGLGVPVDVIVVSAKDAYEWGDVYGTVVHAALSEGQVVAET